MSPMPERIWSASTTIWSAPSMRWIRGGPVAKGRVDALHPQIRRLEHVRVGRENHGRRHRAALLIAKMF
jgi:hypothetical protein